MPLGQPWSKARRRLHHDLAVSDSGLDQALRLRRHPPLHLRHSTGLWLSRSGQGCDGALSLPTRLGSRPRLPLSLLALRQQSPLGRVSDDDAHALACPGVGRLVHALVKFGAARQPPWAQVTVAPG